MTAAEQKALAIGRVAVAVATFAVASTSSDLSALGQPGEFYLAVERAVIASLCDLNKISIAKVPRFH